MTAESPARAERLSASPPLFDSPFLDRFTRVHPALPAALYGPAAAVLVVASVRASGWLTALPAFLTGYLVWTLTEYWVHRLVFHWEPSCGWGRRLHWTLHGIHHEHPNDVRRVVMPPVVSLPVAAVAMALFELLPGRGVGHAVTAGFFTAYAVYETVHYRVHHHRPSSRVGRTLRRRHLLHHFDDHERGFGVSCPYWDHVFGTAPRTRTGRAGEPGTPLGDGGSQPAG
ncbi:sterol desaturase family protein [Streptomyces sp. DT190]|jgi:sterol desaturase/sphingolipid hydroxylase (fatty acid hydroxylase superfamily)|uniref:sterol desaturase family protein n=1 Tax=unclassified Streptomyces TaxID=2593676 RepID=UPI003CECBA85